MVNAAEPAVIGDEAEATGKAVGPEPEAQISSKTAKIERGKKKHSCR